MATVTATNPPPYSLEDSKKAIDELNKKAVALSPENEAKAKEALGALLAGGETKKQVADEISKLTGFALSIDNSFRHGSAKLADVIENAGPIKAEVENMKAQWDKKHNEYIDLMWASRDTAVKARAVANDFAGDFTGMLKDPDVSLDEKKKEITKYRAKLMADQGAAQKISQGFTDLRLWVVNFKSSFDSVGENVRAKNELRIKALEAKITAVEADIVALDLKISQLDKALKITLGVAGGAALLGLLCPVFFIGAIGAALAAVGEAIALAVAHKDRANAQEDVDNMKAEKKQLQDDNEAILQVRKAIAEVGPDADNIITKLAAFGTVWAMIAADLGDIEATMDLANSAEGNYLFKKRIETVAKMYEVLSFALYKYATTVDEDPLFKDKPKDK